MENISRKVSAVHERADSTEEVFGVERQLQVSHNDRRNCKDTCPGSQGTVALIQVLTALIGNFNSPYRRLNRVGLVLWIFHLTANTIWDGYASRDKYGYPWVAVRGLLWVTCIVCTWLTICRTVPWLEQGLGILEFDRQYKDVLLDMSSATRVRLIAYEVYLRTRRCYHSQYKTVNCQPTIGPNCSFEGVFHLVSCYWTQTPNIRVEPVGGEYLSIKAHRTLKRLDCSRSLCNFACLPHSTKQWQHPKRLTTRRETFITPSGVSILFLRRSLFTQILFFPDGNSYYYSLSDVTVFLLLFRKFPPSWRCFP